MTHQFLMPRKNKRRTFLKTGIWFTPIVSTVALPDHAQTSCLNIVDISPPIPPGGVPCSVAIPPGWDSLRFFLRNDGCDSVLINSINALDDLNVVNWSVDISFSLPYELSPSAILDVPLIADRLYNCIDNGSLTITLFIATNRGDLQFTGFRSELFL